MRAGVSVGWLAPGKWLRNAARRARVGGREFPAGGYSGPFLRLITLVLKRMTRERPDMPEPLDSRLRDDQVLDEIEMTSRLIIAASSKDGPLSQREVDEILGVVSAR